MPDRRYITFRCFGCPAFVNERVAGPGRKPKVKPPTWELRRAVVQDADIGVLREVQLPFCSKACADDPDTNSLMARKVHAYLGLPGPPPERVVFRCVQCGVEHHSVTRLPPLPWRMVPLPAPDFDTGAARVTSLPVCSVPCLNGIGSHKPGLTVLVERTRLLAGRGV